MLFFVFVYNIKHSLTHMFLYSVQVYISHVVRLYNVACIAYRFCILHAVHVY
uniref:Uncharacterized protein n=1 Tax=Anguilla anguilla TaxID=7936 RepID=A0A0E9RIC8_ANGAN